MKHYLWLQGERCGAGRWLLPWQSPHWSIWWGRSVRQSPCWVWAACPPGRHDGQTEPCSRQQAPGAQKCVEGEMRFVGLVFFNLWPLQALLSTISQPASRESLMLLHHQKKIEQIVILKSNIGLARPKTRTFCLRFVSLMFNECSWKRFLRLSFCFKTHGGSAKVSQDCHDSSISLSHAHMHAPSLWRTGNA